MVCWCRADHGGSSRLVQERLKNVQQIQASHGAFAAILRDGSVVTWGDANSGATAVRCRISCEMCSRSKRLVGHLLQSWVMDLSSPGAMPTAMVYRISCEMCSRSKLLIAILLQSCVMDLLSPGVVAAAVRYRISCEMCSRSKLLVMHLLHSSVMDLSSPGIRAVRDQLRDVQQIQASNDAFAAILDDGSVVTLGS